MSVRSTSLVEAQRYVRNLVGQSNSSFFWGMRILPARRRRALYAVYAFSRVVDDIADGNGTLDEKLTALAHWREEVERIFNACPRHPIGKALLDPVTRYQLPKEEFFSLIDGMEMDAAPRVRIASLDELLLYCRRVAGSVGILSVHVFGAKAEPGAEMAIQLGQAFQLTNILRDVIADAALDRIYLPKSMLSKHQVPEAPMAPMLNHPGLAGVCEELAALAHESYAWAEYLIRQLPWLTMRPPILMKAIYKPLLERLEQRGWRKAHESVQLSGSEKLWAIIRNGLKHA